MNREEYQKFITPQSVYVGSKSALIKAIRLLKPYPTKELREYSQQKLFRIYNSLKNKNAIS